ncbi:hypothetical protein BBK82_30805 [Lentzea guizhouensis]|uniref:Uncharacterized protein n=1 Tax=Lentzea guizhouensis TaxID=1586287 RepID=A0A1B2HPY1_9PSEU|nr:hypothetical protein [Lentzea guizhouensis]ANZ39777.1 hypothetical protein BBK82_30805 [Lentzea guizhouensis]
MITASRLDEHAPSTVYPAPWKSKWLHTRPAMVLLSPPASISSSGVGKGSFSTRSAVARTLAAVSPATPDSSSAAPTACRSDGQRSAAAPRG